MVVRGSMNKTGIFKVFLIGTRRYAYRQNFRGAKVPEWVITAMNSSLEDSTEEPRTMLRVDLRTLERLPRPLCKVGRMSQMVTKT